ncbi:MAG TPA: HEPN domain-containing protein, partial [Candidatus Ratteibacteria bacterium]|nr:HEPN domain-containing protein [Candidatus Ratteibacteria bacterium]
MVNKKLINSYLERAKIRRDLLKHLMLKKDYSDVIRESQEIVELIEKAILIYLDVNPPKWHDTIDLLISHAKKLPSEVRKN